LIWRECQTESTCGWAAFCGDRREVRKKGRRTSRHESIHGRFEPAQRLPLWERFDGALRRQLPRLAVVGFGPLLGLAAKSIQHCSSSGENCSIPLAIQIGRNVQLRRENQRARLNGRARQTGPNF